MEVELNQKLSWMKAQQATCYKNLSLQYQQEKEELLQKHLLQVREMTE